MYGTTGRGSGRVWGPSPPGYAVCVQPGVWLGRGKSLRLRKMRETGGVGGMGSLPLLETTHLLLAPPPGPMEGVKDVLWSLPSSYS